MKEHLDMVRRIWAHANEKEAECTCDFSGDKCESCEAGSLVNRLGEYLRDLIWEIEA